MDSIKFYQGQEDIVVVEKKDYGQSIFKEQYSRALLQLEKMVTTPKKDVPSILAFCGDRGEGKTSCMETVREMIGNLTAPAVKSFMDETFVQHEGDRTLTLTNRCQTLQSTTFERLKTIDPAFFDEKHNVLELVLGEMFSTFKKYVNENPNIKKTKRAEYEKLEERFHDAKWCLTHMESGKRNGYDPLEELDSLSAGMRLREKMDALLKLLEDGYDKIKMEAYVHMLREAFELNLFKKSKPVSDKLYAELTKVQSRDDEEFPISLPSFNKYFRNPDFCTEAKWKEAAKVLQAVHDEYIKEE